MTPALVAPSRFAGLSEGLPRTYWFLWVGMLINRLGGFVVPMLMVYLTKQKNMSLVEAGIIVSMYGAGSLGGNTLGGVLSDRIGRRVTLLICLVSSAALMMAVSVAQSPAALTVSVLLLGVAAAMYHPATQAMVADLVEPKYRIKAFSYQYWAVNLGFSLAALIGGFMATKNFALLFVLDAVSTLIFAAIVWRAVPETKPAIAVPAGKDQGSLLTPYLDAKFAPFMALSFIGAFIFMQHLTMLPVDMTQKGLSTSDFGIAIAVNGLMIVLLQTTASRVVMGGARAKWLAAGSVILGVGFGLTTYASTLGFYAFTVAVWTVAEVILAPINASMVADFAPTHLRGRYQGAFSLTWSLAMMVAPIVSPMMVEATSMRSFWFTCFGLGVASGLGHLFFVAKAERERLAMLTTA